jgi:hypothetical protein
MKILRQIGLSLLFAYAFCGCVSTPTPDEVAKMDYGQPPINYSASITNFVGSTLKDPDSAEYRNFSVPKKGGYQCGLIGGFKQYRGWKVFVEVNAKNSYGGYIGYQSYIFLFQGENIVAWNTPPDFLWHLAADASPSEK